MAVQLTVLQNCVRETAATPCIVIASKYECGRVMRAETVSQIHVGSGTPGCSFRPTGGMRGAPPPPPLTGACS